MLYKYEEDYVEQEADYSIEILKQLATIPAPSYHEEKRAQFCKQWFEERGIDAKIDKMNNVVIKMIIKILRYFVVILMLFLMIWSY